MNKKTTPRNRDKKEILELCPSLSASTVERHLKKLTADNYIAKYGVGKNTFYLKLA